MKKIQIFAVYILTLVFPLSAQPRVEKTPVIIDTDGASDDLRAICMLAAIKEIKILAITTSDGALSPDPGQKKSKSASPFNKSKGNTCCSR